LGISIAGFVDESIFHQLLQWHSFYWAATDEQGRILSDGLFHIDSTLLRAPAVRYDAEHGRRYKTLTQWARGMVRLVHRWQPTRALVLVGEGAYAVLEFLDATRTVATLVTRLRLDARLFAPAPPRTPGQKGRPRLVGARLPALAARLADPTTL